jgi:hypothetical protein
MKNDIKKKPNKVKLNQFHQIKRKKKAGNPKKKLRDLERLIKNVRYYVF